MPTTFSFLDSSGNPVSYLNEGSIRPGKTLELMLKLYSTLAVNSVFLSFFPGLMNRTIQTVSGNPVLSAKVIRSDTVGDIKKTAVAKNTTDGILTQTTNKGKIIFYDGVNYVDQTDLASITLPTTASQKLYLGMDEIYRNYYFHHSALGFYTGLYRKYSSASTDFATPGVGGTTLPGDASDGTSGHSANGTLFLGTLTPALAVKCPVNGVWMYWIEVGCTGVTTPAVVDNIYFNYVYEFVYSCLYKTPLIYIKSAAATPIYTADTNYIYLYANRGEIVYNTNPLAAGESLTSDYSYKIPQLATTYTVLFVTPTTVTVNGGAPITVVCDDVTENSNVIDGVSFVFSSSADTDNSFSVQVEPLLKYLWYAPDSTGSPGTYQNMDLSLGNLGSASTTPFWIKFAPSIDTPTTLNSMAISGFCTGTDA